MAFNLNVSFELDASPNLLFEVYLKNICFDLKASLGADINAKYPMYLKTFVGQWFNTNVKLHCKATMTAGDNQLVLLSWSSGNTLD